MAVIPSPTTLRSQLLGDGRMTRSSWPHLAKHVVASVLGPPVYKMSFVDLRDAYLQLEGAATTGVPQTDDEFYRFVCDVHLSICREPRETLLELFEQAAEDLRKIDEYVSACDAAIAGLGSDHVSGAADGERSYERRYYEYKRGMNLIAREEICTFLARYVGSWALARATVRLGGPDLEMFRFQYSFRGASHLYDPANRSDIHNKLHHVTIPQLRELDDLYLNDLDEFYRRIAQYVLDHEIPKRLIELVASHHRLNERRPVIEAALEAFNNKQWVLFCNVVLLQVEGIFDDYCLELGKSAADGAKPGLHAKVIAVNKETWFPSFEYFAFRFPIWRNRVAHGGMLGGAPERHATMFLLDLYDVVERLASDDLPMNRVVSLLRRIDPASPDLLDLVRFVLVMDLEVPAHYALGIRRQDVIDALNRADLAGTCLRLLKLEYPGIGGLVRQVAHRMKKAGINPLAWTDVFKMLSTTGDEKAGGEPEDYWRLLEGVRLDS